MTEKQNRDPAPPENQCHDDPRDSDDELEGRPPVPPPGDRDLPPENLELTVEQAMAAQLQLLYDRQQQQAMLAANPLYSFWRQGDFQKYICFTMHDSHTSAALHTVVMKSRGTSQPEWQHQHQSRRQELDSVGAATMVKTKRDRARQEQIGKDQ